MAAVVQNVRPSSGYVAGVAKNITITVSDENPFFSVGYNQWDYSGGTISIYATSSGGSPLHTIGNANKRYYGEHAPPIVFFDVTFSVTIPLSVSSGTYYVGFETGARKPITVSGTNIVLKFYGNGSTSGSVPSNITGPAGTFTLPSQGSLAKSGFTFGGWKSRTSGAVYGAGTNKHCTSNEDFDAYWVGISYRIQYIDMSGGGTTSGTYTSSTSDQNVVLKSSGSQTGKTFSHFEITSNTSRYSSSISGNNISIPANAYGNIVIYARWTNNIYTFTLNKTGGSGGDNSFTVEYGVEDMGYINLSLPSRTGYTFLGYYTATSGGTQRINHLGDPTGMTNKSYSSNQTFYAQWSINSYMVSFRNKYIKRDGTELNSLLASTMAVYNTAIIFSGATNPTKTVKHNERYDFIGWHTDNNSLISLNSLGSVPANDITFYAIYKESIAGIKIGKKNIDLMLGNTQVKKVYVGNKVVWEDPKD